MRGGARGFLAPLTVDHRSAPLPVDNVVLGFVVPGRKREGGAHGAELVAMQRAEAGQDLLAVPGQ